MRISVSQASLASALQTVVGVVEKRQTMPILSHVLLQANGNDLVVVGTDLEVEVECITMVHVEESGQVTVPGRKLHDLVKNLPSESDLQLYKDGERCILECGRSRFELNTLAADEFPRAEAGDSDIELRLQAKDLAGVISACQFSMAQQDVRYYLNGMLWELAGNELRGVATDGHRLSWARQVLTSDTGAERRVIVPRKGINEIAKMLSGGDGEVSVLFSSNFVVVTCSGTKLVSKLIDGRFPDYERVIPKDNDKIVLCDTDTLRMTLARAAILANERYRGVRFSIATGVLRLEAENPERESGRDEIEVDYDGDEFGVGFNVSYVSEVLQHITTGDTSMAFKDETSSVVISEPDNADRVYVVMPMRL